MTGSTQARRISSAALCLLAALLPAFGLVLDAAPARAAPAIVVALGASQTYGKGVSRAEAYPAQLQALLRARGHDVRVVNAGINGNTTGQMLGRLNGAVPNGTKVVILQPGTNDSRFGLAYEHAGNTASIRSRLAARGIAVIMVETLRGLPRQPDGQHITSAGHRALAERLLPQVESALGR